MKKRMLVLACALVLTQSAIAADAKGKRMGPFLVSPSVETSLEFTDNVYRSKSQEKSSTIFRVAPSVNLSAGSDIKSVDINLGAELARYSVHSDDNAVTAFADAKFTVSPSDRLRLEFGAGVTKDQEERGTGRSETSVSAGANNAKPDESRTTKLEAALSYGIGKGMLDFGLSRDDYSGTNNSSITAAKDHDTTTFTGMFSWQVAPKTRLLFEGRRASIDYDQRVGSGAASPLPVGGAFLGPALDFSRVNNSFLTLDSVNTTFYVGAEWKATAKTTGSIRVGNIKKNFDDAKLKDISETAWEAALQWAPRTYSTVSVSTGRTAEETYGAGSASVQDYIDVNWDHAWNTRYSTKIGLSRVKNDFNDTPTTNREDVLTAISFGASYQMRRWLDLEAGVQHESTNSTLNAFDYDRNSVFVGLNATF